MAGLLHRNQAGLDNGPSAGPRLAVNNKENKVGIHFLSLRVGGPPTPTHTDPAVLPSGVGTRRRRRAPPGRPGGPPSGTHAEPACGPDALQLAR